MTHPAWMALSALPLAHSLMCAYGLSRAMRTLRRFPPLAGTHAHGPVSPRLSIVVPACNEASTIEVALRSKLASNYPDFEIVLVEDRSTDETGAIVDRIAREDSRLRVIHIEELPAGWLGKVHALHCGAAAATGELLLFSDADVLFSEDLLVRAATAMETEGLDFVTLVPDLTPVSPALDAVLTTLLRMLLMGGRVWLMHDPKSRAGVGAGAFNLVRRTAFDRSPGFEWLKMEVADDIAFGQMMKRAGARCAVFQARGDVKLPFYTSLGELIRGVEKNGYAVVSAFRPLGAMVILPLLWLLELLPIVATFVWDGWPRVLAASALALMTSTQLVLARWLGRPLATAAFPWFGALVMGIGLLRSIVLVHARAGIVWRGTFYSIEALRAGVRLERP